MDVDIVLKLFINCSVFKNTRFSFFESELFQDLCLRVYRFVYFQLQGIFEFIVILAVVCYLVLNNLDQRVIVPIAPGQPILTELFGYHYLGSLLNINHKDFLG